MIDAIRKGDETAFRQVYDLFKGKVYGYFLRKTQSSEDSRDLLQTTFLRFWKYRQSLSTEYLPDQQLFHIARTVYIDYLRAQSHMSIVHDLEEPAATGNLVSEFDLRTSLSAALDKMPELRMKIFRMKRLEGYSYDEIAKALSVSVKTVDNNLAKALKFLRQTIVPVVVLLRFI